MNPSVENPNDDPAVDTNLINPHLVVWMLSNELEDVCVKIIHFGKTSRTNDILKMKESKL